VDEEGEGDTMGKKTILLAVFLLAGVASAAPDEDHHAGISDNRSDVKIFRWGENRAGDCHQVNAVLEIHPDGRASFRSEIWTHTHGTDVWHSTIHLRGPGGELGDSGNHDSPGIPHNHDGPENRVPLNFDFAFPAGNFGAVTEAIEHSSC
jgi:hypothetical protein